MNTVTLPLAPLLHLKRTHPLSTCYRIDEGAGIVRVTYHAQPSVDEWSETMERIFADPLFQHGFGVLLDRRSIVEVAETAYVTNAVQFIDRHLVNSTRWAILVSNPAAFGMGRMSEFLCKDENAIRSFWDEQEAVDWLRLAR